MITNNPQEYFTHLHDVECNQKYGGNLKLPYSFHLQMVYNQGLKFREVILKIIEQDFNIKFTSYNELTPEVTACLWGHDSIEDGRLTYNDLQSLYGKTVAEVIYLCTDYKGRNREERKPDIYYIDLAQNKIAVFVKLCDIIANIKFSLLTNSTMYDKYKKEWTEIKFKLIDVISDFKEMVLYINRLFEIES